MKMDFSWTDFDLLIAGCMMMSTLMSRSLLETALWGCHMGFYHTGHSQYSVYANIFTAKIFGGQALKVSFRGNNIRDWVPK
jgi:hypothetical protein